MDNDDKLIDFDLSDAKLQKAIESYKNGVKDGTIETPCPSDWYAFIGFNIDQMRALYGKDDGSRNRYKARAKAAKKMLDWCRNQLVVHPYWGGKNAVKSMYLLKQDWGDGVRWDADAKTSSKGPSALKVEFGGGDSRAKAARK